MSHSSTGATSVYDTILAEDWVDHPLGPGQQPRREGFKPVIGMFRLRPGGLAFIRQPDLRGVHQGLLLSTQL